MPDKKIEQSQEESEAKREDISGSGRKKEATIQELEDLISLLSPSLTSPVCKGPKTVYGTKAYETCPVCSGTGVHTGKFFCWTCHGKGAVHVTVEEGKENKRREKQVTLSKD